MDKIVIKGARVHNLKNISLEIPKNKLVVFTGISGSGKSSLAFDTIYAEGQRRYVESLSSYARQFLGVMDKPDVDSIEGLSPAIAIDQKGISHNPRSTVGTITEIYDYLRLLFARIGHPHCPFCGKEISRLTLPQIVEQIFDLIDKKLNYSLKKQLRLMILAPLVHDRKGEYDQLLNSLKQKGYSRVRIDGVVYSLAENLVLIKTNRHTIEAVVDRLSIQKIENQLKSRLFESAETALKLSDGSLIITEVLDSSFEFPEKPKKIVDHLFSERFACPTCNLSLMEIEPRTLSFNSPHGACPTCHGLGCLLKVDPNLILNPNLTIKEGGIIPFARMIESDTWFGRLIETVAETSGIPLDKPLETISREKLKPLLWGTGEKIYTVRGTNRFERLTSIEETFEGLIPNLERRYEETESDFMRQEIEKYMRSEVCLTCFGSRLKKEALGITINELPRAKPVVSSASPSASSFSALHPQAKPGVFALENKKSIVDIVRMPIGNIKEWILSLSLTCREQIIAKSILRELSFRLEFLIDVGLNYLSLERSASTLSGGETQRIRLASQIGNGLSGVIYVLDEPSVGLHQRDNKQLIQTLKRLRGLGNTVIVVEHDREMIEAADWLIDFGPKAGEKGGEIIAQEQPATIKKNPKSLTGKYLSNQRKIEITSGKSTPSNGIITVVSASHHNLKNITVNFPLGCFICVTGVSGSGKSTFIHDILYHGLMEKLYPFHKVKPGKHKAITGFENLDRVILIDQSPIGRTPRSNPATYTGVFNYVRTIFAQTSEARMRGYKPGRFSFNVKGGRCEACLGEGQNKIEMQFLPDVYVTCEVCGGKRYNYEALEVTYKGKNIAGVLEMTVEESLRFFNFSSLVSRLQTLYDVGLGYIKLGQPAPTLSGGEAQRVKLAAELGKRSSGRTLYLLDEPTTGLHFADLEKLLYILRKLVTSGNTVIVIEHNLDVIKNADYLIDLGPEGGEKGGEIIASGTPYEVSLNKKSYTGQFLAEIFSQK